MRLRPRHPGNLLIAVVLACGVWYVSALDRRERISERQLDASVTLVNVPAEMVITSEVPRTVSLRIRGPLNHLRALDPANTGVVVDLRGASEGEHEFEVEARNVAVPEGMNVLAVSPSQLPLRLERVVRRRLPVRVHVVGEPAPGLGVIGVAVEPATAVVSGPRLQLEALHGVATDPVNVDGAEGSVETVSTVRSPHPLMRVIEPLAVHVTVTLAPVRPEPRDGRRR